MNIIINRKDGTLAYQLIKLECGWELQRWHVGGEPITKGRYIGNVTKAGWRKMAGGNGLYPSSISSAVDMVVNDLMSEHRKDVNIAELRREVKGLTDDLSWLSSDIASTCSGDSTDQ